MALKDKEVLIKERFTEKKSLDFVYAYSSDILFQFDSKEKICFYLKLKYFFLGLFFISLVMTVALMFTSFSVLLKVATGVVVFLFLFTFLFLSKKHERAESLVYASWSNANKLTWLGFLETIHPYLDAPIQREVDKVSCGFYSLEEFKNTYDQIRSYVLSNYPNIQKMIEKQEQELLFLTQKQFQCVDSTLKVTDEMRVYWQLSQPFVKNFHENALQKK